jgi:hypothetical protein
VPSPGEAKLRVAIGANFLHEFSHAFAMLSDEYIRYRDDEEDRVNPTVRSVLTLSNLSYSDQTGNVGSTSPPGLASRASAGPIVRTPVIGWLWLGGRVGRGSGTRITAAS